MAVLSPAAYVRHEVSEVLRCAGLLADQRMVLNGLHHILRHLDLRLQHLQSHVVRLPTKIFHAYSA